MKITLPRFAWIIILIAGIILIVFSLLTDTIGVGRQAGFGLFQTGGTIIGLVMVVLGIIRLRKK